MIRVGIVDDQALVREGLRALLERSDDIAVVGEAAGGREGFALAASQRPDVLLMDIRMPDGDGLEATRQIATDPGLEHVRVVMLTTFDTDEYIFDALRAGAAGFLLKDTSPEEMREAMRTIARGDALLSPAVTERVMQAAAASPSFRSTRLLDELTERERDVLTQIATGQSNAEIAANLYMSPATARTHVGRILAKLGARDRAQLVILAYETGLLIPGSG